MLKPQRLLARHPLHESSKLRLRALKPRERARVEPRRAALLAAHGPLITIHTFRRRFAHRAVTVPGRGEQVEQIRSHAITSVSRWERDITRLSPPLTRTPSGITANNPDRSASERTNCQRNWAIYQLQTTCTLLTSPTPQPMGPVLDIEHHGLWQLGNLMAPRLVTRNLLTLSELPPAPRTIVWVVINDLSHLTLSKQPAPRAAMTRLPARLAVLAILAGQLLRFLARLRPTLLTRLGSIPRRCLRTVARTRGRFLLQRPQPLLGPRLLIDHSHQERDTRLTPRVIDRLSLRPVHTSKIRRPPQRTLLWKTTTSEPRLSQFTSRRLPMLVGLALFP